MPIRAEMILLPKNTPSRADAYFIGDIGHCVRIMIKIVFDIAARAMAESDTAPAAVAYFHIVVTVTPVLDQLCQLQHFVTVRCEIIENHVKQLFFARHILHLRLSVLYGA